VRVVRTNWAGVRRTEIRLEVENRATDHRLRARFDVRGPVYAAVPFDVVARDVTAADRDAGAAPFHPMTLWVDAEGGEGWLGRTVIAPGLHEYEPGVYPPGGPSQVGITLLRCVGQLSGRGDGPGIPTPGAQCIGRHVFELAVSEHDGDWEEARAWKRAHQFAVPLVAVQAPTVPGSSSRSYVEVEPDALVLSALKSAEDRDALVVRFYNTTTRAVTGGRVRVAGRHRWRTVNLNEEPLGEWQEGEDALVTVGAKRIMTLEFAV